MPDSLESRARSEDLSRTAVETLEGRLPVLPRMRLYSRFAPFLWTCATLGCASYAYLVGASLATIGNTWTAIVGYWLGTLIGMAVVMLAVGLPSFRYGIDTVDASKSALGVRGSLIFMLGIVFSCVGWGNVLVAMTARSAGILLAEATGAGSTVAVVNERAVIVVAVALVFVIWRLAARGPQAVESLSKWCVPGQVLIALLLLVLLLAKYSPDSVAHANVAATQALTSDRHLQLTLAIEFGLNNGFTMTPFLGGLTRLVVSRRILATPPIVGYASGAGFISGVAALATAVSGSTDPLTWLTIVAGPLGGAAIMLFLIVANVGALVTFIYLGGIAIQQIGALSKMPWQVTTGVLLAPSLVVAFKTQWMLGSVMELLTYNGVMFVGLTGVLLADHYLVRRQQVMVPHLFSRSRAGQYWYRGGINWIAIGVVLGTTAGYFALFNPVTLAVASPFHFMGAAAPLLLISIIVYWALIRLLSGLILPRARREAQPIEVEL